MNKTSTPDLFPEGIKAYKPSKTSPPWIVSEITIKRDALIAWLKNQPETVKLDLKLSKANNHFLKTTDAKKPS